MLTDVAAQHVAIPAAKGLQAVDSAMRTFADAIGIIIREEYSLETRFDDAAQRMMHDTVAEFGSTDFAPLWFMNEKVSIGARRIVAVQ